MRQKAYDSDPIPCSFSRDKYVQGTRDQVFITEQFKDYTDLEELMEYVASDDPRTQYAINKDLSINLMPSKKIRLKVDKQKVLSNGTVPAELADQIVDNIDWTLPRKSVLKNEMIMLDILASNKWERPIYFAISAATDSYIGLKDYFQLEGFAYRFIPVKTVNADNSIGRVHLDKMYDNFMNKYQWGGIEDPDVFLDFHHRRTMDILSYRTNFARLGVELLNNNKSDSAEAVFDRCQELMPNEKIPYDQFMLTYVRGYYTCNAPEKAIKLSRVLLDNYFEDLDYYYTLDEKHLKNLDREKNVSIQVIGYILDLAEQYKQKDLELEIQERMERFAKANNLN